jgi:hypothetical protein
MLFELQAEILFLILSYLPSLDQLVFFHICKKLNNILTQFTLQNKNRRNTELQQAAKKYDLLKCFTSIFLHKADVNSVDSCGNTALHSLMNSSPYTMQEKKRFYTSIYLLWHKAAFLKKNEANNTPLDLAIAYGHLEIIKIFIALFLTNTQADIRKLKLALQEQISNTYGESNLRMTIPETFQGKEALNNFLAQPSETMTPLFNGYLMETKKQLQIEIKKEPLKVRRSHKHLNPI